MNGLYKAIPNDNCQRSMLYQSLIKRLPEERENNNHARFLHLEENYTFKELDEVIPSPDQNKIDEFEYIEYMKEKYSFLKETEELSKLIDRNIRSAKYYLRELKFIITANDLIPDKSDERIKSFGNKYMRNDFIKLEEDKGCRDFIKALKILPFGKEILTIKELITVMNKFYLFSSAFFIDLSKFLILSYKILLEEIFDIYLLNDKPVMNIKNFRNHKFMKVLKNKNEKLHSMFLVAFSKGLIEVTEDEKINFIGYNQTVLGHILIEAEFSHKSQIQRYFLVNGYEITSAFKNISKKNKRSKETEKLIKCLQEKNITNI